MSEEFFPGKFLESQVKLRRLNCRRKLFCCLFLELERHSGDQLLNVLNIFCSLLFYFICLIIYLFFLQRVMVIK